MANALYYLSEYFLLLVTINFFVGIFKPAWAFKFVRFGKPGRFKSFAIMTSAMIAASVVGSIAPFASSSHDHEPAYADSGNNASGGFSQSGGGTSQSTELKLTPCRPWTDEA